MCLFVALGIALSAAVGGAAANELPSAFARAPTASDRLPTTFHSAPGEGRPFDSRRIATFAGTKRVWSVYIFKQRIKNRFLKPSVQLNICVAVFTSELGGAVGGGGGCSPTESFFSPQYPHVTASATGRVVAGVTSDRVARVAVVGSRGVVHDVPLSRDHGFIFNCRAYNGCACVVSRLQAFDRVGNRIANQNWRSPARNCRP